MKYFTINELCRSTVAASLNIDNTPNKYQKENLIELVENLLDPIRDSWSEYCKTNHLGNPGIRINSGYRSKQLNSAVNGSKTSSHLLGLAVDIVPINGQMKAFQEWLVDELSKYPFDQMIREKVKNGIAQWIHLGYRNSKGEQRRQIFTLI